MARLITIIAALSALAPSAFAAPQTNEFGFPNIKEKCEVPSEEYEITNVSEPYFAKAESVGGSSCPQGNGNGCEHQKGQEHSVGVTESVSGGITAGLNIGKILELAGDLSFGKSWSKEDTTTVSTYTSCPDPKKGTYLCGMQVRPKKIKTKGKVHKWFPEITCRNDKDFGWVDYEIEAPALAKGGPNEDSNVMADFQACILSCYDDPDSLDCPGVKSAQDMGVPLCPGTKAKSHYEPGWCTAHITQHQRWQGAVDNKFKFSLRMYDGDGTEFYNELYQEVNNDGVLSVTSLLPKTVEIKTGSEDNDWVEICYNGECFTCDDNDGGGHGCTLGNGDEYGYENNQREGDFGFTC